MKRSNLPDDARIFRRAKPGMVHDDPHPNGSDFRPRPGLRMMPDLSANSLEAFMQEKNHCAVDVWHLCRLTL